jgi:Ca-activated chloride channel family protein
MTLVRKTTAMAFLGAVGALLGAAGGEVMFRTSAAVAPPPPEPRSICLVFDISGSMTKTIDNRGTTQLEALKQAATDFVQRQDLVTDGLGLVVFASKPHIMSIVSHDAPALTRAIGRLEAGGTTDLGGGLDVAGKVLDGAPGERWVLLFSDGKPEGMGIDGDPEVAALNAAMRLRHDDIRIVAIGTGLADDMLLAQVTGRPENVILSDPTALADAFARSEKVIRNRQMLAIGADGAGFRASLLRAAVWAGLIAIGAGLALVVAQNRHMRRRLVGGSELMIVIGGGILTGAFAGAAGQSLFYFLAGFETIGGAGRVVAWVVLGCGVGFGMSHFVPNLNRRRAVAAGTIGGAFAAVFFLTVVPVVGDTIGRLLGACVLGLATGATLVLMEITYRKAWLVVDWGRNETSTLLLGRKPIIVGNAKDAHICPAFDENGPAVLATIGLQDDGSVMLDRSGDRRRLEDGERIEFGKVTLLVRTAVVKDPDATPPDVPAPPPPSPKPKKKAKASSGGPKWYDNA